MSTSNNQTAVKTLSDVTITKCNPINETGSYVISFSDGSVLQGGMPYSYLGLYTYDVEYTKMTYANSVITKITPKKKPLNFVSLVALMRASLGEETSTADILSEAEFDKSFNAPDQSEKFKTLFPVLYEKLEKTMEGLKYFHFESISVLATTYGMGTLHLLKEEKIKMLIATLKLKPCHFMFECMIPDHRIRELSLDEYTAMAKLMGHTVQMEERVAESIYRTILKKDLSNGRIKTL